jgi:hypothetical protein
MATQGENVKAKIELDLSSIANADLLNENRTLSAENAKLTTENLDFSEKLAKLGEDLKKAIGINTTSQDTLESALSLKQAAEDRHGKLKSEFDALVRAKEQTETALGIHKDIAERVNRDLDGTRRQLETVREEHQTMKGSKSRVDSEFTEHKEQSRRALETARQKLSSAEATSRTLQEHKAKAERDLVTHQEQTVLSAKQQADTHKQQTDALQQQIQKLTEYYNSRNETLQKKLNDAKAISDRKLDAFKRRADSAEESSRNSLTKLETYSAILNGRVKANLDVKTSGSSASSKTASTEASSSTASATFTPMANNAAAAAAMAANAASNAAPSAASNGSSAASNPTPPGAASPGAAAASDVSPNASSSAAPGAP